MASVQQYLISARFITTMGHFIALLLLFSTIDNNIDESLGDSYASGEKSEARETAWVSDRSPYFLVNHSHYLFPQAALIIGFLCFVCDFAGMFFGTSLFYNTVSPPFSGITGERTLPSHSPFFPVSSTTGQHVPHSRALHRRHSVVVGGDLHLELQSLVADSGHDQHPHSTVRDCDFLEHQSAQDYRVLKLGVRAFLWLC